MDNEDEAMLKVGTQMHSSSKHFAKPIFFFFFLSRIDARPDAKAAVSRKCECTGRGGRMEAHLRLVLSGEIVRAEDFTEL